MVRVLQQVLCVVGDEELGGVTCFVHGIARLGGRGYADVERILALTRGDPQPGPRRNVPPGFNLVRGYVGCPTAS